MLVDQMKQQMRYLVSKKKSVLVTEHWVYKKDKNHLILLTCRIENEKQ